MKTITLMRHGEATGSPDIDRQLTIEGKRQCTIVSAALPQRPDFILCSGVDRTRQSLLAMDLADVPTVFCGEDLYRAHTHRDILDIIAEHIPQHALRPLIIGHNPTIHETVCYMARETRDPLVQRIAMAYAPSTASVFEMRAENWDMVHPSTVTLIDVISGA